MNEHNVALRSFLAQMQKKIKELEDKVKKMEDWKEKQPVYTDVDGKWEIVPYL